MSLHVTCYDRDGAVILDTNEGTACDRYIVNVPQAAVGSVADFASGLHRSRNVQVTCLRADAECTQDHYVFREEKREGYEIESWQEIRENEHGPGVIVEHKFNTRKFEAK